MAKDPLANIDAELDAAFASALGGGGPAATQVDPIDAELDAAFAQVQTAPAAPIPVPTQQFAVPNPFLVQNAPPPMVVEPPKPQTKPKPAAPPPDLSKVQPPTQDEITWVRDRVRSIIPKAQPTMAAPGAFMPVMQPEDPAQGRDLQLGLLAQQYLDAAERPDTFLGGLQKQTTAEGGLGNALPFAGSFAAIPQKRLRDEVLAKMQKGEPITQAEQNMVDSMALMIRRNSQEPKFWEQVGELTGMSAPYAAEFMLTGPAYTATKALTAGALKQAPRAIRALASRGVGVAAQTAVASPGRIVSDFMDRMAPSIAVDPKDLKLFLTDPQEDKNWMAELTKAGLGSYIENLSERTGAWAGKAGSWMADKVIPKETIAKLLRLGAIRTFMDKYGSKTINEAAAQFKKAAAFNGVPEEIAEEYIGAGLQALTGVQGKTLESLGRGDLDGALFEFVQAIPSFKDAAAMAVSFGMIPAGQTAASLTAGGIENFQRGQELRALRGKRGTIERTMELQQRRNELRQQQELNAITDAIMASGGRSGDQVDKEIDNAINQITQQGGVPPQPPGTTTIGQAQPGPGVGNSVSGPAGSPPGTTGAAGAQAQTVTEIELFHGSLSKLDSLKPGTMLTDDPAWAVGYTTKTRPDGRDEFHGTVHKATVSFKNPIIVRSLHDAEGRLIELAQATGKPSSTLQQAAALVAESTGADAIVAVRDGKVVGAIPLGEVKVTSTITPKEAVETARSSGRRVPDNINAAYDLLSPPSIPAEQPKGQNEEAKGQGQGLQKVATTTKAPEVKQPLAFPVMPVLPKPTPDSTPEQKRADFQKYSEGLKQYDADLKAWEAEQPQNKAIIFKDRNNGTTHYAVTKDPQGGWRVTTFTKLFPDVDKLVPWGHTRHTTRLAAVKEVASNTLTTTIPEVMDEAEIKQRNAAKNQQPPPNPPAEIPIPAELLSWFQVLPDGNDRIILKGKTYDVKETIKQFGGRWNPRHNGWSVPKERLADLTGELRRLRGTDAGSRDRPSGREADPRIARLRATADGRPDTGKFDEPVGTYIGSDTQKLIEKGLAIGMPEVVVAEQVEDVARINRAWQRKNPMFLLASEPGSGKTFVLGGAIREMRKAGAKKIVYVTLRQELISQIQQDLKEYGMEGVEFITYPAMRKAGFRETDVIIFDEAHSIKNVGADGDSAQQAAAAARWIENAKFTIMATATPAENPVQMEYLESTGVFAPLFGNFRDFAKAFGAREIRLKSGDTVLRWDRTPTSDADAAAARDWLMREGMYTSRRIRLPTNSVDSRLVKTVAPPEWENIYNAFTQAAADNEGMLVGFAKAWIKNFQKRLLEAAKVPQGIAEAEAAVQRGRFPIIFVETKAERQIDIPDLIEQEREWQQAVNMALAMGDAKPKRKDFGLPPQGITQVLESFMQATGTTIITIPSAEDLIIQHFGEERVAVFTGSVTPKKAQENLNAWRKGTKPILVATMAKGGTGLSLHDKKGDHQTTQININLPWTATQVVQVAQRSARYGLKGMAEMQWLFADNIPFDRGLAARVGRRMAEMGSLVHGQKLEGSDKIEDWDFEDLPFSEQAKANAAAPLMPDTPPPTPAPPVPVKPVEQPKVKPTKPARALRGKNEKHAPEPKPVAIPLTPTPTAPTVKPVETKAEQQTPISAATGREQKKFLLTAIDEALAEAPDASPTVPADADLALVNELRSFQAGDTRETFEARREEMLPPLFEKYNVPDRLPGHPGVKSKEVGLMTMPPFSAVNLTTDMRYEMLQKAVEKERFAQLPKVTIDVPDDGTFNIINTKAALTEFKKRAAKFPTTAGKRTDPSVPRGEFTRPSPVGTGGTKDVTQVLEMHVSDDETREVLHYVFSDGKVTVASDGRRMVILQRSRGGTPKKPSITTTDGKPVKNDDGELRVPNWNQIIPEKQKPWFTKLDTERLFTIVRQAQEATTERNNAVGIWRNPDGSLSVTAGDPNNQAYQHNLKYGAEVLAGVNPQYLLDAINSTRRMGNHQLDIYGTDSLAPITVKAKDIDVVIMPMRVGDSESAPTMYVAEAPVAEPETVEVVTKPSQVEEEADDEEGNDGIGALETAVFGQAPLTSSETNMALFGALEAIIADTAVTAEMRQAAESDLKYWTKQYPKDYAKWKRLTDKYELERLQIPERIKALKFQLEKYTIPEMRKAKQGSLSDGRTLLTDPQPEVVIPSVEDLRTRLSSAQPVKQASLPEGMKRPDIQKIAKDLGLPATGRTEEIAQLVDIATKPPQQWTLEEFRKILPQLSIHQDLKPESWQRVQNIMQSGLEKGMVDDLSNFANDRSWTWASDVKGDAYLFLSGKLKFLASDSPWLASGNKPIAHLRTDQPIKRGDIEALYRAITQQPESPQGNTDPQASLPDTEPAAPTEPIPDLVIPSVEDLRGRLSSTGLTQEAQDLLGAFLDSPLGQLLDGVRVRIADTLDGGWQGSYFQRVVEIARAADALTGPHEFLHRIWEILPEDIKSEFERMRQASLQSMLDEAVKNGQENRAKAIEHLLQNPTMGAEEFLSRRYPFAMQGELYQFSSAEELFTHSASSKFKARAGSLQAGFWDRLKEILKDFVAILKNWLGWNQTQDEWLRNILAGNFTPTLDGSRLGQEQRKGSLTPNDPVPPKEVEEEKSRAGLTIADLEGEIEQVVTQLDDDITTRVFGREDVVKGKVRMDESFHLAGQQYARRFFTKLGLAVEQDASGRWRLQDPLTQNESAGIMMVSALRKEIQEQHKDYASKGGLANLLDSIVVNMTPDSIAAFSPTVRGQLYAFAQGERSHRGLLLGALSRLANTVQYVARNAGVILQREYQQAFGQNGGIDKIMADLVAEFNSFFTEDEYRELLKLVGDNTQLRQLIDQLIFAAQKDQGGRVYRRVQSLLKPKQAKKLTRLEEDARVEEAVEELLAQAAKQDIKPVPNPNKKLSAIRRLALLTTEENAERVNEMIEEAVRQAEYNAGVAAWRKSAKDKDELAEIEAEIDSGADPSQEFIEEGLSLPQFSHWREIRDNLLGYSPVTIKLVQDVIKGDFKGVRFGAKKPVNPETHKIDLNALSIAPDDEVRRVLDTYAATLDDILVNATPETRIRARKLIMYRVTEQLSQARKRVRDPLFKEPAAPGSAPTKEEVMNRLRNAGLFLDPRLDLAEMVERVAKRSAISRFVPSATDLVKVVFDTPVYKQADLGGIFAEKLISQLGVSQEEADNARKVFETSFAQKFAEAKERAKKKSKDQITPKLPQSSVKQRLAIWRKIENAVNAGIFDTTNIIREIAREHKWYVPTQAELDRLRALVEEEERYRTLTPQERASYNGNEAMIADAERMKARASEVRREKIKRQFETLWSKITMPLNLTSQRGRENISRAAMDIASANLILKLSFTPRQAIDVFTQAAVHTPTRAIQEVVRRMKSDPHAKWSDIHRELYHSIVGAYWARSRGFAAALIGARAAFAGTAEAKNVDRLMSGVNIFDRAQLAADEAFRAGQYAKAFAYSLMNFIRLGFRIAQAMDVIHGLPAEYQEIRGWVVTELRRNGMTSAEAELKADTVIGNSRADYALALARAQELSDNNGWQLSPQELQVSARNMIIGMMYERVRRLGLNADDLQEHNKELRSVIGWNEREDGGLGGIVGGAARMMGTFGARSVPPVLNFPFLAFSRFSNAIAISINRKLMFTPLGFFPSAFGVTKYDAQGNALNGSPWMHTEQDRVQRKIEAAAGTLVGSVFAMLAYAGYIVVNTLPPKDPEERELWEREGHKAGTVEIPTDDGFISLPLITGPLSLVAPYLALGGKVRDTLVEREKQQAKLNAEAAEKGLQPGKIPPWGIMDYLGVAGNAAWGALVGGRTATGMVNAASDYGRFDPRRMIASSISPFIPSLPAMQELSRMGGIQIDSKAGTVWDYLVPIAASKNSRRVNMLGDPVGTEDDVMRVIRILTGGVGWGSKSALRDGAAYAALDDTGFRPPSISRSKGYQFGNDFRPMTDEELAKYTQLRGKYFKEALESAPGILDEDTVRSLYQVANVRALQEVGVMTPYVEAAGKRLAAPRQPVTWATGSRHAPRGPGAPGAKPGGLPRALPTLPKGAAAPRLKPQGVRPVALRRSLRGSRRRARGPSLRPGRALRGLRSSLRPRRRRI